MRHLASLAARPSKHKGRVVVAAPTKQRTRQRGGAEPIKPEPIKPEDVERYIDKVITAKNRLNADKDNLVLLNNGVGSLHKDAFIDLRAWGDTAYKNDALTTAWGPNTDTTTTNYGKLMTVFETDDWKSKAAAKAAEAADKAAEAAAKADKAADNAAKAAAATADGTLVTRLTLWLLAEAGHLFIPLHYMVTEKAIAVEVQGIIHLAWAISTLYEFKDNELKAIAATDRTKVTTDDLKTAFETLLKANSDTYGKQYVQLTRGDDKLEFESRRLMQLVEFDRLDPVEAIKDIINAMPVIYRLIRQHGEVHSDLFGRAFERFQKQTTA
jgi:hypothetical protein